MDWKSVAIEKLKDHEAKRQALETIPLEIAQVESMMVSIRSASADGAAIRGSKGNGREDMLLGCIVRKDELQRTLERTQLTVDAVDGVLDMMSHEDRLILDRFFVHPVRGNLDRLCEELFLEKSAVYKRRDTALRRFTIAMYGAVES